MSTLFAPIDLGNVQIKNRFVHSATYEVIYLETGEVSDNLIKKYQNLVKGELVIGLIRHPIKSSKLAESGYGKSAG
jgi:2,4-dienoyl-CoA reductase-like NADH-dependent reductase (Old Yellow Enzyme family)